MDWSHVNYLWIIVMYGYDYCDGELFIQSTTLFCGGTAKKIINTNSN